MAAWEAARGPGDPASHLRLEALSPTAIRLFIDSLTHAPLGDTDTDEPGAQAKRYKYMYNYAGSVVVGSWLISVLTAADFDRARPPLLGDFDALQLQLANASAGPGPGNPPPPFLYVGRVESAAATIYRLNESDAGLLIASDTEPGAPSSAPAGGGLTPSGGGRPAAAVAAASSSTAIVSALPTPAACGN